jgi:ubiquinone/menaquinone biosynthesis C-methylase UbiE
VPREHHAAHDLNVDPDPRDLSFDRRKKRSIPTAIAFRSRPVLIRLLGYRRVLSFLLEGSRVIWRLAFETACEYFGEQYFTAVYALSPTVLQNWIPSGAKVLDVGCGNGRVTRLVADRASSVLGVDYDAGRITSAEQAQNPVNVSFQTGDARQLSGRFDVVIVSHLLEHLDDPDAFLAAAHEIAPMLVVEVPDIGGDALNIARMTLGLDFSSDADHVREYSKSLLAAELERNAWQITAWADGYTSVAALAHSRSGQGDS